LDAPHAAIPCVAIFLCSAVSCAALSCAVPSPSAFDYAIIAQRHPNPVAARDFKHRVVAFP